MDASTGWFRYDTTNPGTCNDIFGTRAPAAGGYALGAGGTPDVYSEVLTGLTSGTTYYYCAIASNSSGTAFGMVLSFTTPGTPSVVTSAATTITSTTATLNATANPNMLETTGWFRYSSTDPGTCDESFGTRVPAAGGTALGNGTTSVPYTEAVTGLLPGTKYYYCALASNTAGVGLGSVLNFTTPKAPTVTTVAATAVSGVAATLNGTVNANQGATTAWFRYDTTDPGTCDDAFGTRLPMMGGDNIGSGNTPVDYSKALIGLAPMTTYYFCAIAENSSGKAFGAVLSFGTTASAPTVTTDAATAITPKTATINGTVNANQLATLAWFRYSATDPGTCDDTFGTRAPTMNGTSIGSGSTGVTYSEAITGLLPATTYYFCAIAENTTGKAFGDVLSFMTTADPPTVVTSPPTNVQSMSAELNGSANPNGTATMAWFRYDSTDPGSCDDTFGTRVPAVDGTMVGNGLDPVAFTESLTGLTTGTTYYYCAIASNPQGTTYGEVVAFQPGAIAPTVTTEAAKDIQGLTATLNGTANPNGTDAIGWFRLGDTDPMTTPCDDSYGTRVPVMGGVMLGAGIAPVPFTQTPIDLEPNKTYYYCAAASNLGGAAFGTVLSFKTLEVPPIVKTVAADVLPTGDVTLNGAANPQGSKTIGWFRFDTGAPAACNDLFGTRVPTVDGTDLGVDRAEVPFKEAATSLKPGTYYYCAIASNAAGVAYGDVLTFDVLEPTTPPTPKPTDGCGCRMVSTGQNGSVVFLAAGLFALAMRRRQRKAA
jgi:MYXO-CTERM domain-containing protein